MIDRVLDRLFGPKVDRKTPAHIEQARSEIHRANEAVRQVREVERVARGELRSGGH